MDVTVAHDDFDQTFRQYITTMADTFATSVGLRLLPGTPDEYKTFSYATRRAWNLAVDIRDEKNYMRAFAHAPNRVIANIVLQHAETRQNRFWVTVTTYHVDRPVGDGPATQYIVECVVYM